MIVFLVSCFFVFSMIHINNYSKKFYEYHISHDSCMRKYFNQMHSEFTCTTQTGQQFHFKTQINENKYREYCNNCCSAHLFSLTMFGINSILHVMDYKLYQLGFVVDVLNYLCFFFNLLHIFLILYNSFLEVKGLKLAYNFLIVLLIINNYLYCDIKLMYFYNFIFYLIPGLFKSLFEIYEINYKGNDKIIKTLDFFLNYIP
jgi:hypothetical protein